MRTVRHKLRVSGAGRSAIAFSLVALVLAVYGVLTPVWAFKPVNFSPGKNASDSTHQSITEDAIRELDSEFFGVNNLTTSMKAAIDDIWERNALIDVSEFFDAHFHFDDETFAQGQELLISEFNDIVSALQNNNSSGARTRLGQALHTIQDFYSHSNWVELGNGVPNPSLGRPGQTIQNTSPLSEVSCISCTLPPCTNCQNNTTATRVTSGYFGFAPLGSKPANKCSHGGSGDSTRTTPPTGGINKDASVCDTSPHDTRHPAAAALAKEATKQFIRDIKAAVTPRQLGLLLGFGPTLTISMDTTGSMGPIIEQVKNAAIQIVNDRLGTSEEPAKYVLAPFNDPDVGPVTVTTDADTFKTAISALFASGGGDCPELSMTGMLQGLGASDQGGDLFMFTDASSKDAALAGNVISLAQSKDIKIFPIVFGSCSPIDPAYERAANETGGQLFSLGRGEAGRITMLADAVVRSNTVDLLSIADTVVGNARTFGVPVDPSLTSITFSISGTTTVTIARPNGVIVSPIDPDVSVISLSSGAVFTLRNPEVGLWIVTLTGSGNFSLLVSGEASLSLRLFRFVDFGGRPGHEGFFPIAGLPLAGRTNTAHAIIDGAFTSAQFELRSQAGLPIQVLNLTQGSGLAAKEFMGDVLLPGTSFIVYVTGVDPAGNRFQRALTKTIQPQTVEVVAPLPEQLHPGQLTSYTFVVTNLGPLDTFSVSASDDARFLAGVSPSTVSLDSNKSTNVVVQLQPPANASPGTSDTLTLVVRSTGASGATNSAVVTSFVGAPNRPPDTANAKPGVAVLWPPDHRMVPVSINGVTDPDGDPVTIHIDRIMQDEPTNGVGDGDTCPDGQGIGSATALLRAERNGARNGRVYTISFTATDGRGGSSTGTVKVTVPHDQGHKAVEDEGPLFDSTSCQ